MDKRLKHEIYDSMSGTAPPYIADVHEAIPMRYNPRRKPYLDALHHWGRVWVPDVYFVKHGDFRSNLDPVNVALRIFPNGTVYFTTRYTYHVTTKKYAQKLRRKIINFVICIYTHIYCIKKYALFVPFKKCPFFSLCCADAILSSRVRGI